MDEFLAVEHYLAQVKYRCPGDEQDKQMRENLKRLKQEAVARGDQEQAKKIWCYEIVQRVQNQYLAAFETMQEQYFYAAWCTLERVEINLQYLERHFDLNAGGVDTFLLYFIKKHIEQFQNLFPYEMFGSPGFMILEKVCSICAKPISIRQPCGHVVGEVYNGEMCARSITKFNLIEISLVPNPVQKYSVMFLVNESTGESEDHYNYWDVDYVVRRLSHPFAAWDMVWTTKRRSITEYRDVGRNDRCPCGSGEKFKRCCLKKDVIEGKHLSIQFSEPPPPDLLSYEEHGFIRGRGLPLRPTERENLIERLNALEVTDEI